MNFHRGRLIAAQRSAACAIVTRATIVVTLEDPTPAFRGV